MTKSVIVTFHSNGNIGCEERYLTEDEEQLPLLPVKRDCGEQKDYPVLWSLNGMKKGIWR